MFTEWTCDFVPQTCQLFSSHSNLFWWNQFSIPFICKRTAPMKVAAYQCPIHGFIIQHVNSQLSLSGFCVCDIFGNNCAVFAIWLCGEFVSNWFYVLTFIWINTVSYDHIKETVTQTWLQSLRSPFCCSLNFSVMTCCVNLWRTSFKWNCLTEEMFLVFHTLKILTFPVYVQLSTDDLFHRRTLWIQLTS